MRILISGSSGLVGQPLVKALEHQGHQVIRLIRQPSTDVDHFRYWDPEHGLLDVAMVSGFDAVIHLGGENIASGRWTPRRKERIQVSRVDSTRMLAEAIATCEAPPSVFLCASAIGYYGEQGDRDLDETSPAGEGYLAEVCRKWEEATEPARQRGIRVVNCRIGVVLSRKGGALQKMLPPFRLGIGGVLGSGRQYMSWIALDDVVGGIIHALYTPTLDGPINLVSPNPATNRAFTQALGKALWRPTLFPIPAPVIRILFGEMGDALLLGSAKIHPRRLQESHYSFLYPTLELALPHLLRH